jgi:hypothetical protein
MSPSLVVLDSNLAVLLAVTITNRSYIEKHKRLRSFDVRDFDLLFETLDRSAGIIFSPNVASETSNLIRYVDDPIRSRVADRFAVLVAESTEQYVASRQATQRGEYTRLGLTDVVMLELLQAGAVLLTVDSELYLAAENATLKAMNFNHLRDQRKDYQLV